MSGSIALAGGPGDPGTQPGAIVSADAVDVGPAVAVPPYIQAVLRYVAGVVFPALTSTSLRTHKSRKDRPGSAAARTSAASPGARTRLVGVRSVPRPMASMSMPTGPARRRRRRSRSCAGG